MAPAGPPAAAGPRAFVLHHTSGGGTPADVVDDWKTNRPGIGTQYIMDRQGVIHDVKAEFGYTGTSHVLQSATPKAMQAKGLINPNMVGMEIIAKDDKDVTPAQAQAAAQFIQTKYPNIPVYGHGELNPGHREADEGQTAKAAVMALRNGGAPGVPGDPRFPATGAPKMGPDGIPIPPQAETANAAPPANLDNARMKQAFLATIAKGEAPKGAYGLVNGSSTPITDFSKAPTGTAASGQYQFLPSTWAEQAAKYGYKDFKPETQDTAAWNYANDVYKQKTGKDLMTDLMSGDKDTLNSISTALGQTWTSLPGGPQPNDNWKGQNFADVYNTNLTGDDSGGTVATATNSGGGASAAAATPAATSSSDSKGDGKSWSGALGEGLGDIGNIFAKTAAATKTAPIAANLPILSSSPPQGPVPLVDPRKAEAQRQQLAIALGRLNSRRLV